MQDKIKDILDKKVLSDADLEVLANYEPNDDTNRLYSFFTPIWLCEVMYKLAIRHGFDPEKGKVLEPSCGNGNFLTVLDNPKNCYAFELDPINYAIAKKRNPKVVHLYRNYFETAFLQPPRFTTKVPAKQVTHLELYPFDLVIGNPPYGKRTGLYKSTFPTPKFKQTEMFFMYKSLELLKKGGLLVFITSSSFMRNGNTYLKEKKTLSQLADFQDAYRMPKVFKNTSVPTDILIFKRK